MALLPDKSNQRSDLARGLPTLFRCALAVVVAIGLTWLVTELRALLAIDSCLDRGGRWHEQGYCEGERRRD